ncbi:MAG: hypothetical protein ACSLE8_06115 [Rhodococcus sp. (in: high G+C Gram-positive bacteria)]
MNLTPTNVSVDSVFDGYSLLVEFLDGSFKSYTVESPRRAKDHLGNLRHLRAEQVLDRVSTWNKISRPAPMHGYHAPSSIAGAAFWR